MTRQARDHTHLTSDVIDPGTDQPSEGGSGGASDLETVLATGNTTGENTIVMPSGTIDGTTDTGSLLLVAGNDGNGAVIEVDPITVGGTAYVTGGTPLIDSGLSGGSVALTGGNAATNSDADGGDITLTPGEGVGAGRHGQVIIGEAPIVMPSGTIDGTTVAGRFQLATPDGDGNIGMFIGMSIADASNGGGSLQMNAGAANSGNPEDVLGGSIQLTAGDGGEGIDGGSITLLSGRADNTAHAGSRVELRGATTTRDGLVFLYLPTADPLVAGALWANLGIVTVSAG